MIEGNTERRETVYFVFLNLVIDLIQIVERSKFIVFYDQPLSIYVYIRVYMCHIYHIYLYIMYIIYLYYIYIIYEYINI